MRFRSCAKELICQVRLAFNCRANRSHKPLSDLSTSQANTLSRVFASMRAESRRRGFRPTNSRYGSLLLTRNAPPIPKSA